ncbi:MAG: serine/threonine protein kinase [Polyangiaceae bacterium]|nr:serine/threonine protein kinase [Polyangiaceae bacterium]
MTAPGVSTIGKYQLIASLGHGGMADVYLAVVHGPVGFNKLTVIKKLRASLADEPEFLAMFLDEARLAARLNHPNVVQTNEVAEVDGVFFIAMEFLDGQPLNRILNRLQKQGELHRMLLLRVVADALAGLHHAHELSDYDGTPLGVVHRDASPHNLFVTYDGQTKVVDFGIAKAASRSSETRDGVLKGKVAYMAPEQSRSEDVDRRADVYAMGVVMWEVIAGQRMRKGSDLEILDRITRGEMPDVRTYWPDCPGPLVHILARATAQSARDRYPTANHMRQDIVAFLDTIPERTGSEEVGKLVSGLFEHKRVEMRSVIEKQLSGLRRAATEDVGLRLVDARKLGATDTLEVPRVSIPSSSSLSGAHTPMPSLVSVATPSLARLESSVTGLNPATPNSGTTATSTLAAAQPTAPRSRFRGPMVIAVVAAIAATTVFALRRRDDVAGPAGAPSTSATTTATAAPSASTDPNAGMVEIRISVRPENAKLFLDDAALPTNPFVGRFKRDDRPHALRVEAEGFANATRTLSYGSDQFIEIALDKAEPTKDKPTATPGDPTPRPGTRPKKKLDSDDPWR